MKVSTTLENIEYTLQQKNKNTQTQQEQRKNKQEYLNFLKGTIKDDFYLLFEKNNNYEDIYNDLILNSNIKQNYFINLIREESERRTTKTTKLIVNKQGNFEEIEKIIYLWDNFNIEEDIQENYFKILDNIYKEYKKKQEIYQKRLIKQIENDLSYVYEEFGYKAAHKTYYSRDMDKEAAKHFGKNKNDILFIIDNYYEILKKIDNKYKTIDLNKEHQTNDTYTNKNVIERNKGKIYVGSAILGICKGIKKAIK